MSHIVLAFVIFLFDSQIAFCRLVLVLNGSHLSAHFPGRCKNKGDTSMLRVFKGKWSVRTTGMIYDVAFKNLLRQSTFSFN